MTDAIAHVQAAYEPLEDRILLNITTRNQQVYSAWITRRYLRLLIPALQGKHPRSRLPLLSDEAFGQMHSKESDTDPRSKIFDPYEKTDETQFPLGEAPIVLVKIAFKGLDTDAPLMELNPDVGAGFALPYEAYVIKVLLKVLQQALQRAEWDLEIDDTLELPEPKSLH